MVVGINTRRPVAKMTEEGVVNAGAHENQVPPQDNLVPPLEQVCMGDRVPVISPPMTYRYISAVFLNLAQAMTSQDNVVTSQVQAMTVEVNQEVGPHMPLHAITMASRFGKFSRMNPPIFFGSEAGEGPQDFLDEVYKILFVMGVTTGERPSWQTWYTQWMDNRVLRGAPFTWNIFKRAFLDRFF